MKSIWLASVAALVLPVIALPGAARAQQAATTMAAADELDPNIITVTATRRTQALSDVPVAVTAIGMEQLRNSGGNDIRQLNQLAPSLLVSSATNESNGAARIRGVGTVGENPGLESSVAVFIDGVYRSRTGVGLTDLGELDRIEVLRGPQGTLFGRNASAGLLNITTAKPKFEFGGLGEATYGNFNNVRIMGSLTGPILGDKVAFRLDGLYNKRDGFLKDVTSGRDLNDRDRFLIRGQLLIQPNDDLSIRLIGDYNQKNEECCGAAFLAPTVNLSRDAAGQVVTSPNSVRALITSLGGNYRLPTDNAKYIYETSITPGEGYEQRTRDWGVSGELNWDLGAGTLTSITAYREFRNRAAQDADFNNIDILRRDDQNRKFQTFTQELRFQGNAFDDRLDYLVGAFYAHETLRTDDNLKYGNDYERYVNAQIGNTLPTLAGLVGFTPAPGQSLLNNTGIVQGGFFRQVSRNYAFFTHNVFAIVPDKLDLTLGARYTNENKKLESVAITNNNLCGALRAAPAFTGAAAALNAARAGATALSCVINNNAVNFNEGDPGTERPEDEFTGTVVLSYKPTDRLLTYASYSRGYKAGGFNLDTSALDAPCNLTTDLGNSATGLPSCATRRARPPLTAGNARPEATDLQFEQETVDAFEIGAKLDLREFKLNVAAFYQKFNNFQLNTFNGVNFEVANIAGCADDLGGRDRDLINENSTCTGKSRPGLISKGVEIEALLFPAPDLAITTGITYTNTNYAKNLTGTNGASLSPVLFQLPGARISNSSDYVVTGSVAWTPKITEDLSSLFYFDFRYMSELNTGSDLDFEKRQPGFAVANARIGIYGKDQIWGIEFWGQNIFNTLYQQVAADAPLQGGGTFRAVQRGLAATANQLFITFPAEPRTYGVTVRTRF
jgi:outer membrane receptor protein involved in Fe transport